MNIGAIITATVVVAAVGLFIGIFLSIAGKKFAVETDEREVAVREALPETTVVAAVILDVMVLLLQSQRRSTGQCLSGRRRKQ